MKNYQRQIKAADLLHKPWSVDSIQFESQYLHSMPNIQDPGISWEMMLQSLNWFSVKVIFENIVCSLEDISDVSGTAFIRPVSVPYYEALFIIPWWEKDKETYSSFEDIYDIDAKDLNINLEECVYNAIKSQEPIVKLKNDEILSDWWEEFDI